MRVKVQLNPTASRHTLQMRLKKYPPNPMMRDYFSDHAYIYAPIALALHVPLWRRGLRFLWPVLSL